MLISTGLVSKQSERLTNPEFINPEQMNQITYITGHWTLIFGIPHKTFRMIPS